MNMLHMVLYKVYRLCYSVDIHHNIKYIPMLNYKPCNYLDNHHNSMLKYSKCRLLYIRKLE